MERPSALGYEPQAQTEVPLCIGIPISKPTAMFPQQDWRRRLAYAKIIADVNKLNLKDLVRP